MDAGLIKWVQLNPTSNQTKPNQINFSLFNNRIDLVVFEDLLLIECCKGGKAKMTAGSDKRRQSYCEGNDLDGDWEQRRSGWIRQVVEEDLKLCFLREAR